MQMTLSILNNIASFMIKYFKSGVGYNGNFAVLEILAVNLNFSR